MRSEGIDLENAAHAARAVQGRACAAQQFGAFDQVGRIRLPVDLSAEGILGRDPIDQDHAAVQARPAERRSNVAVVGERAVAACFVRPG